MLPEYPPDPRHTSGFDMMLVYASVEDGDHARAQSVVRALRRDALRRGATQSAAKALWVRYCFERPGALWRIRRLVVEAPGVRTYALLNTEETRAGHAAEARVAAQKMLRTARRVGDLDGIVVALRVLAGNENVYLDSYSRRSSIACNHLRVDPATAYAAGYRLKREALRANGRFTAILCVLRLLVRAAYALDTRAGLRFARELLELETSSLSHLALALALERVGRTRDAGEAFASALRLAYREGDIHRATKATAGLLRAGAQAMVSPAELRWTMREARKEPEDLPDYLYLRASLGLWGVGEAA